MSQTVTHFKEKTRLAKIGVSEVQIICLIKEFVYILLNFVTV